MHDDDRLYRVRARGDDHHHGRVLRESNPEAAAIAYVEHRPFVVDEHEVGVIVRDVLTGHERSYLIHFDPGEAPEIV